MENPTACFQNYNKIFKMSHKENNVSTQKNNNNNNNHLRKLGTAPKIEVSSLVHILVPSLSKYSKYWDKELYCLFNLNPFPM